jgi:hypothetical protein
MTRLWTSKSSLLDEKSKKLREKLPEFFVILGIDCSKEILEEVI